MTKDSTQLGDRMKRYEAVTHQVLPRRTYSIVRVDLRAGHTYLRKSQKPFDYTFINSMKNVAIELFNEIQGAKLAYTQSDEVSVLFTDFDKLTSEPWFGGVLAKQQSVSASVATATLLSSESRSSTGIPTFDARVFTLPDAVEVANYFIWRQRDCIRNSVMMAARAYMSHSEVQKRNVENLKQILRNSSHPQWEDHPSEAKLGRVVAKSEQRGPIAVSSPLFDADPAGFLAAYIPKQFAF